MTWLWTYRFPRSREEVVIVHRTRHPPLLCSLLPGLLLPPPGGRLLVLLVSAGLLSVVSSMVRGWHGRGRPQTASCTPCQARGQTRARVTPCPAHAGRWRVALNNEATFDAFESWSYWVQLLFIVTFHCSISQITLKKFYLDQQCFLESSWISAHHSYNCIH